MKSERSVEWVDLILVPLSDKFDIKCLFVVVFFLQFTNESRICLHTDGSNFLRCLQFENQRAQQ